MTSRAIVSVAVREPYVARGARMRPTLDRFGCCDYVKIFDNWPPGAPTHFEHHYAFKWGAFKHAADLGYKRILWLDSACVALAPLEPMWQEIESIGHLFAPDENALGKWSSDESLARYGVTRDAAMDMRLFCGSWFGLNFDFPAAASFFEEWGQLAAAAGGPFMSSHSEYAPDKMRSLPVTDGPSRAVISDDPRCVGHRSDETYYSLMAHARGMSTSTADLSVLLRTEP